jgi:P27 family predicted phage terminase small subunit
MRRNRHQARPIRCQHRRICLQKLWLETVAHLTAHGTADAADAMTIETFVPAVLRQRRIMAEIEAAPLVTDGKISPLLRVAEATAATVKNLAHVLGLNPVARQRLPRLPQKSNGQVGSKWSDL